MEAGGSVVYRVRGRYYATYRLGDARPTELGRFLVDGIPEAPEAFETWRRAEIAYFRGEEARILRLLHEDRSRSNEEDHPGDQSRSQAKIAHISRFAGHDPDSETPSRFCPVGDVHIVWLYIIDLDLNVFRITNWGHRGFRNRGQRGTQFFRLNHLPRALFRSEAITSELTDPVMDVSIPHEYLADHLTQIPTPAPSLLTLFASFSPAPTPAFNPPPAARNPIWHNLHLRIMSAFVPYYINSFRDAVPSRTSSPYVFRQLAYATLSLTRTPGLRFHRAPAVPTIPDIRTPSWEPPDADFYWLDDVLIVLNPHIGTTLTTAVSESTHASMALAAKLSPATPTTAVLFSLHAIILVYITPAQITHTPVLPLFTLDAGARAFTVGALEALDAVGYESPGVLALLDLFTAHAGVRCVPGAVPRLLPTELWRAVVRCADEDSLVALEGTCRFFREVVGEYPRVGGEMLVGWEEGKWQLAGGGRGDVTLVEGEGEGWEVGAWGSGKVCLGMPVVQVV